mgnify:CR=1 FL=1
MPEHESIYTLAAQRKGDALYEGAKEARTNPGIPLGMVKATPEQIRAKWASLDDQGRRNLANQIGIEAIVKAHQRRS